MDPIRFENEHDELQYKLTAYALGELDDAQARELEEQLKNNPALQAELEEIRALSARLSGELGREAQAGDQLRLSQEQKQTIHARADEAVSPLKLTQTQQHSRRVMWWRSAGVLAAMAACVAVLVTLQQVSQQQVQTPVASRPTTTTGSDVAMQTPADSEIKSDKLAASQPQAESLRGTVRLNDNVTPFVPGEGAARQNGAVLGQTQSTPLMEQDAPGSGSAPASALKNGGFNPPVPAAAPATDGRDYANSKQADPARRRLAAVAPAPETTDKPAASASPVPTAQPMIADRESIPHELIRTHRSFNTEAYDTITDNPFMAVSQNPLSTFSIDVDTGAYANVRRFLYMRRLPPAGAVRIEEMINYFPYHYEGPGDDKTPFAVHVETGSAPWAHEHRLVKIGLKGKEIAQAQKPAMNLVFLIDVSGSMTSADKLPLLKEGMKLLVNGLTENDRVSIVVYAGAAGLVLDSTPGSEKNTILAAIDKLMAGGSTNGGAGIQLAYELAQRHFIKEGVNRVILASDGDFNVGVSSRDQLIKMIEEKRQTGVFLSVLGFGTGNLKDATMEQLANKGNGQYHYIDSIREARKVLVHQMAGNLITIAKDVKIQVEFNPARVQGYRLIGYENRMLAKEDFNDDTKDAGEIGTGHTVTAVYEVVPVGVKMPGDRSVDPLKYQPVEPKLGPAAINGLASEELLTVKLRYKQPDGDVSTKLEVPVVDSGKPWQEASSDFKFVASVAQFGMLLRNSPYKGTSDYAQVLDLAQSGLGEQPDEYRQEFVELINKARQIQERQQPTQPAPLPTPTPLPARE